MKKHTYQFVQSYFSQQNCILLDEIYINNKQKLKHICVCGNQSTIAFSDFQNGYRCQTCRIKKLKLSYEYVQDYFLSKGCKLLSTTYINNKQKLDYICVCGNKAFITFDGFQKGQKCKKCQESGKFSYQYVQTYFKEAGCILLSTYYKNTNQKLDYMCECSNISVINFGNFQTGTRCRKCGTQKAINTSIARGHCLKRTFKNDFELYSVRARNESNKNYTKHKDIINPNKLKRGNGYYHLDHKFSIFDGFRNNIPIFIISSIHNLEMLIHKENCSKNHKSSITKANLFKLIYG